jgi:hypothetical protein
VDVTDIEEPTGIVGRREVLLADVERSAETNL